MVYKNHLFFYINYKGDNMKKKLILIYFVIGCVWTIVNLPNLLSKANNNVIKATLLAVFRIIAWPILSGNMLFGKIKQILAEKKAHEETIKESQQEPQEVKNVG